MSIFGNQKVVIDERRVMWSWPAKELSASDKRRMQKECYTAYMILKEVMAENRKQLSRMRILFNNDDKPIGYRIGSGEPQLWWE